MFKYELAKPGDILLYRPGGNLVGKIISFLCYGGSYAHSALYIGNGRIVESHIDTGVVEKALDPKWYDLIDVYRIVPQLSDDQINLFIKATKSRIGRGYDLAAFPSAFLRSTVARIFGWKNFAKSKPVFNDEGRYYCSELIAISAEESLRISLVPSLHSSSVTPSDLGRTKLTEKIC